MREEFAAATTTLRTGVLGFIYMCLFVTASRDRNINEGVECSRVIYSGDRIAPVHGNFTSPSYPNPYPPNTKCTYSFIGKGRERVQIKFEDFNLYMPANNHDCRCQCDLHMRMTDKYSRNGGGEPEYSSSDVHPFCCVDIDIVEISTVINGDDADIDNFCGTVESQMVMSSGPRMIVTFRTYQPPQRATADYRGFLGLYSFVNNFGVETGTLANETTCGFIYNSSMTTSGTFSSPNYPGRYPRHTECHYMFLGRIGERVQIAFSYFDVEGIYPCLSKTESDYVEFSNFKVSVDRKLPRYCGSNKPGAQLSDGEYFRVTFKSNNLFDGTGFDGKYQFIDSQAMINEGSRHEAPIAGLSESLHTAAMLDRRSPQLMFVLLVVLLSRLQRIL